MTFRQYVERGIADLGTWLHERERPLPRLEGDETELHEALVNLGLLDWYYGLGLQEFFKQERQA